MNALPKKIVGYKILVLPEKAQEKTQGGIIIPMTANQSTEQGVVIAVSDQILYIQPGDLVVYPANAGIEQEYENRKYKYLNGPVKDNPGDIIAII